MTGDTGDVDSVDTREVHGGKCLTVDLWIGDKDALTCQRLVLLLEVDVEFRTDEGHDSLLVSLSTNDKHLVAHMEDGIAVGDTKFSLMNEA